MKLHLNITLSGLLLSAVLLAGCASQDAKPAATTEASDGLSAEDRTNLFVHHARAGEIDDVKQGLEQGAAVNGFDTLDQTPLIAAISYNSLEEVKLLLDHGADANLADHAGWQPLHFATWFGSSVEIMQALLDHGAKIDGRNDRGITPLYFASVSGHELQVALLLRRGADRSIASNSGYTPLRAAQVKGYYGVVALLDPTPANQAAAAKGALKPLPPVTAPAQSGGGIH